MKFYICSISFRHTLTSFQDLISFAGERGFAGIELWGAHAETISEGDPAVTERYVAEMRDKGLNVSMISHYIPLMAPEEDMPDVMARWRRLIALAELFGSDKIRIFAGSRPSVSATPRDLELCAARLRMLAEIAYESGIYTVIEFHPDTYFDTLPSAHGLLQAADHPGIRVNVDFLHVWESGDDPLHALNVLKPWVGYFHLKNVSDRAYLDVFKPENVYSPSGDRRGLTALSEGVVDYARILRHLLQGDEAYPASLEWFGDRPAQRLESEMKWIKQITEQVQAI
ncbi:sugar phosphate isomerase/epimerase family protein [Paenibacillus sp. M1]|uniref:Sugar phosphate isomerase/epimerase family protein n=1 Tax=Paenibacillus haidiansis TaxID=1574488 RepID=A0ABU7VTA1_9BACL